jgi:polysaccharide pyruvyl transferase WcaK-like protein
MDKVLLIGIGGTYNYGCEAIIRGTVNILRKARPQVSIYSASYNYEDDIKRLSGCDIKIINRPGRKRWNIQSIIRKLLSYVKIEYVIPFDSVSWVKEYDTVFSIGGDIYTLNHDNNYSKSLPLFCEKCTAMGLKYILWGASIGPFEKNINALKFYKTHLTKVSLIVAREKNTVVYLKSIGIEKNVLFSPDPAFFVAPEIKKNDFLNKHIIGLNLSPLSAQYQYSSMKSAWDNQIQTIIQLIQVLNVDILLLPHVISFNKMDNDLWYLNELYHKIPSKYLSKIHLINSDPGFIDLKQEIIKCDMVIASRMHCAINAISTNVPALFLSYSEKAIGMSRLIYNSHNAVVALSEFENSNKIITLLKHWNHKLNLEEIKEFSFDKILDRIFL